MQIPPGDSLRRLLVGGRLAGMANGARKISVLLSVGRSPTISKTSDRGEEGYTKLLFDEVHHWMLGGGIVVAM